MTKNELGLPPNLRPEAESYSPAFRGLLDAVVRLVEENLPEEPEDKDTYTTIGLPPWRLDHDTSAFIGWEPEPKPTGEIAHVNLSSFWLSEEPGFKFRSVFYRHELTVGGAVLREARSTNSKSDRLPIAQGPLSDEAIVALTQRISGKTVHYL